jgi:hypothetical protein
MPNTHPARTGTTFELAPGHHLYIGPDRDGKGPILALQHPGEKRPTVVARFPNSTAGEHLVEVLKLHMDVIAAQITDARNKPITIDGTIVATVTDPEVLAALDVADIRGYSLTGTQTGD